MSASFPTAVTSFRDRIGRDIRSGHYPVPHRYQLHLSLSCPYCLRIAITHSLLGLDCALPVTLLYAVPDEPGGGHSVLRPLYEASSHQHPGPATAPVLSDSWSGRIVNTHAPDILRDLAAHFGGSAPALHPYGTGEPDALIAHLCEQGINAAAQRAGQPGTDGPARETALAELFGALDSLERQLTPGPYLLGGEPAPADVHLWSTLVQLDTVHRWHLDAAAVHRIADHPNLWEYARRLAAHPSFGPYLDLDGIARRHHARCAGLEAAGAAVQIVDWAVHTRPAASGTAGLRGAVERLG